MTTTPDWREEMIKRIMELADEPLSANMTASILVATDELLSSTLERARMAVESVKYTEDSYSILSSQEKVLVNERLGEAMRRIFNLKKEYE